MEKFGGAKIALLLDNTIISSLRDNKPEISFPNMWDMPGGGREGEENAVECAFRETKEELGMNLRENDVLWINTYPGFINLNATSYFLVAKISQEDIDSIVFGDEGQEWKQMTFDEFLNHDNVIPQLKTRFSDFLASPEGQKYQTSVTH